MSVIQGGPLVVTSDSGDPEDDVQFGVVSWGVGCARKPGVYARTSDAYDWIVKVVCEDNDGKGGLCSTPKEASQTLPSPNPGSSDNDSSDNDSSENDSSDNDSSDNDSSNNAPVVSYLIIIYALTMSAKHLIFLLHHIMPQYVAN